MDARFYDVLFHGPRVQHRHDIRGRPEVRPDKPSGVHLDMLTRRLRIGHGDQGLRRRGQAYVRRQQPVLSPKHIRVRSHRRILHPGADELLQQGAGHLLY